MALIAYPLINGVRHDVSSIDVKVDGVSYFGMKSIDYNDGLEPGDVYAFQSQKIGRTRGQYNAAGGIEFFEIDTLQFEQQLISGASSKGYPGNVGLYEISFDIKINYQSEAGQGPWSVDIKGCRITKRTPGGLSSGNEALSTKYDLNVSYIVKNNINPITGLRT